MHDDDFLDMQRDEEDEIYRYEVKEPHPVVNRLIWWSAIVGGIAIGVILFLFFLAMFIYFFIPLALVGLVWFWIQRWRAGRNWKRFERSLHND